MFSRKSKEEKQAEKLRKQHEEAKRLHQENIDKVIRNRNAILLKHEDKLRPELDDPNIITFSYSPNEKVVVAVYPDRIRLRSFQKGLLATGLKGEKTIYLSQITSVQLKDPRISAGYIQFKTGGEGESRSSTYSAVSDENAVTFNQDQQIEFHRLRDVVEGQIQKLQSGRYHQPQPPQAPSLSDELTKLAALRDRGILTEEEFAKQKRRLLD